MQEKMNCDHDFKNLTRAGRADWRCPECGRNVMMYLLLAYEAGIDLCESEPGGGTQKEIEELESKVNEILTCKCGRPQGHRGVHRGAKAKAEKTRAKRKYVRHVVPEEAGGDDGPFAAADDDDE